MGPIKTRKPVLKMAGKLANLKNKLQSMEEQIESKDEELYYLKNEAEKVDDSIGKAEAKAKASDEKCSLMDEKIRELKNQLQSINLILTKTEEDNQALKWKSMQTSDEAELAEKIKSFDERVAILKKKLDDHHNESKKEIDLLEQQIEELEVEDMESKQRVKTLEGSVVVLGNEARSSEIASVKKKNGNTSLKDKRDSLERKSKELPKLIDESISRSDEQIEVLREIESNLEEAIAEYNKTKLEYDLLMAEFSEI
ncbi:uncharacterized protein LOC120345900 isoform X2 [Styela clava]